MRAITVLLAAVVLASPVFAATVSVQPPAPTSATPVSLAVSEFVTCGQIRPAVRSGTRFTINIERGDCLPNAPPALGNYTVELGRLDPGDYEVIITTNGVRSAYTSFFVRDAEATIVVRGTNIGPIAGGSEVVLVTIGVPICFGPSTTDCPIPTVTFNGVPALVREPEFRIGILEVVTPPNPPGIAEVVVSTNRWTARGRVFRYYDPAAAPLSSMFERVLFPVWFNGAGAYGSRWTTELFVFSDNPYYVYYWRHPSGRLPIQPSLNGLSFGPSRPGGVLFFAPREDAARLQYGSMARDASRQSAGFGTEVRVVRERDLFADNDITLANVPVGDPRFRLTLRIYNVDSVESVADVTAIDWPSGGDGVTRRSYPLRSANPCVEFTPCPSDEPAVAIINDFVGEFFELPPAPGQRVFLVIRVRGRGWAFMTVTNNETQQVTAITPLQ